MAPTAIVCLPWAHYGLMVVTLGLSPRGSRDCLSSRGIYSMINEAITGLLLLSVAIMTNFLGTTLNCQLQKLLKNSPIYKNLAIIFLIYFTINFSSSKGTYPLKLWLYVIFVYILFILLMNQNQQSI